VSVYGSVEPELPVEGVRDCVESVRQRQPDVIVAIGGGSCLDHGKLTAILLAHGGVPSDYYGEGKVPGPVIPVIAVPTTAGTGSEVTPVAVVTDAGRAMKVGISSPYLIPTTAIVDPGLSLTAPATLTAHTGADALAHCVEALTAIRRPPDADLAHERVFVGRSALTDAYALAGIGLIGRSLERAVRDGSDAGARSDLALGALYGGLAFGTAGTSIAHALQYPVGALTHTSHGVGVGVLLPYAMEFNLPERTPDLAQIAGRFGVAPYGNEDAATAQIGINAVATLLAAVGIPRTLAELGLREDQLDEVARASLESARLVQNNPRAVAEADMRLIAEAAFTGDRRLLRDAA
jgi:alcohol dehydrogenase